MIKLKIYNAGSANCILGVSDQAGCSFAIDAGASGGRSNRPIQVDYFFLTHWHEDHYSLFLNPSSSFSRMYYFYDPVHAPNTSTVRGVLNSLFAAKAKRMRNATNLHSIYRTYDTISALPSFGYSINLFDRSKDPNDWSVSFYFSRKKSTDHKVTIQYVENGIPGKPDSFAIAPAANIDWAPLALFPGDVKESRSRYLSRFCRLYQHHVPIYIATHHGSPHSFCASYHSGPKSTFDQETRYCLSTSRYSINPSDANRVYPPVLENPNAHYYSTDCLPSEDDYIFIQIDGL